MAASILERLERSTVIHKKSGSLEKHQQGK